MNEQFLKVNNKTGISLNLNLKKAYFKFKIYASFFNICTCKIIHCPAIIN